METASRHFSSDGKNLRRDRCICVGTRSQYPGMKIGWSGIRTDKMEIRKNVCVTLRRWKQSFFLFS